MFMTESAMQPPAPVPSYCQEGPWLLMTQLSPEIMGFNILSLAAHEIISTN